MRISKAKGSNSPDECDHHGPVLLGWSDANSVALQTAVPDCKLPLSLLAGQFEQWCAPSELQLIPWQPSSAGNSNANSKVWLSEEYFLSFQSIDTSSERMAADTQAIYADVLDLLPADFQLFRVWNFVPDINRGEGDAENYRQFSIGRGHALAQANIAERQLSCASAVGASANSPLVCIFLASPSIAKHVENPRQLPAYRYPQQYGPQSPSFARASILGDQLFISGTSSIVGHETVYVNDPQAQLSETCNNLEALISQALQQGGKRNFSELCFRVYLRNPHQLQNFQSIIAKRFPMLNNCVYLQADICREELVVEIEGCCRLY